MQVKLPKISDVAISVIPSRNGSTVKIHNGIHEAKKAVQCKYHSQRIKDPNASWGWRYGPRVAPEAQIYNIVDNQWNLLYDIKEDTLVEDLPWKKDA